ncbi:MAG: glycosyltransferase family 2 protein [Clostridia bacterium]|nr:glycosyltransferase family 2 protein [Clostridia bacterium]
MKLSIIICVYNTDPEYVRKALQSIANSTLCDYEICMVDDGSTLDYTALAEEFGARLLKTENGGILRARLRGIDMAEGEYITFFDSDDTISVHYHQPMVELADREGADIVINGWAFHSAGSRYYCHGDSTMSTHISAEGDGVLRAFFAQKGLEHSYYVTWNKIYRAHTLKNARTCILESHIGDKNVCYAEDALINFYAFRAAKKLCNLHTGYYFYRIHGGQTVNVISDTRLRAQIMAMRDVLDLMQEGIGESAYRDEMLANLRAWEEMISRTHYSHAKGAGYKHLYPLIQSTYGVKRLQKSTRADGRAYTHSRLLPENIEEIDAALRPLFDCQGEVALSYNVRDPYVCRVLNAVRESGVAIKPDPTAARVIPAEQISRKSKILHNHFVWTVSTVLFPKGSKIRALLKKLV